MGNLFWRIGAATKRLASTPFKTEEEFERTVFEASEILEDIFALKRQIRGGGKTGIPDIIGVDSDGNVCVIEMKNCPVDASIIPQVLQYAIWAETNPDSIKSLWLEAPARPEALTISWDSFQVRILIIAPTILRSTLAIVDKINYPVDLIEVSRWIDGDNQLLLVNRLEPEAKAVKIKPVSGLEVYDEAFYKAHFNSDSVVHFLRYARELNDLVKKRGWNLQQKFNKQYCGFKAGFFNAFGIKWVGSKSFAFFVKLPETEIKRTGVKITKYEKLWKEGVVYIDPKKTKTVDVVPLLEAAYHKLAGDSAS